MAQPDPYTLDWTDLAPRLATVAADEHDWYAAVAADLIRPGDSVAFGNALLQLTDPNVREELGANG